MSLALAAEDAADTALRINPNPDPYGNNACFERNLATVANPTNTPTCPNSAPASSTHRGNCIPNAGCQSDNPNGCLSFSA